MSTSSKNDELYELIASALVTSGPLAMKEIAAYCGLVADGASVPSTVGAKVRNRLKHMIADDLVKKTGEKATTRYTALKKLTKQYA